MASQKSGLGRGLGALLGDDALKPEVSGALSLPISQVESCSTQPRKSFDGDTLNDLAESIRRHGIIQPLTVRKLSSGYYQIVAGERRWRAARMVGLSEVPVVVVEADRRKLDGMSRTHAHQGVIALAAVREYAAVEDILALAEKRGEKPLLVICDEISDPHNLGAIIRTAECAGAHGVVIPKRRSAGLTAIVAKTSAGAVAHLPVARVPNIPSLLKELKKQGLWIFGTAADGATGLYDADLRGPAAIVIGSEGEGMTRLAAENCDFLVSIPLRGKLGSLNASAAAAVLLYEAVRQRG